VCSSDLDSTPGEGMTVNVELPGLG
jgi:hypothetical protein